MKCEAIRFATCSWTQSLRDLSVGAFNSHWHKHPPHPPLSALRTWSGGLAWFGSSGYSQSIPAALLTGPSFATCRIIRNPPASGSLLMICHNRMLLRSLSGVACTTPDTSKSQPTAYCSAQLKQGTCLIRLNQSTYKNSHTCKKAAANPEIPFQNSRQPNLLFTRAPHFERIPWTLLWQLTRPRHPYGTQVVPLSAAPFPTWHGSRVPVAQDPGVNITYQRLLHSNTASARHHPRCSGLRVQGTAISPAARMFQLYRVCADLSSIMLAIRLQPSGKALLFTALSESFPVEKGTAHNSRQWCSSRSSSALEWWCPCFPSVR